MSHERIAMNKIVFPLEQRMKSETNADGRLEVFSLGNEASGNRWQEAPNSNV